MLFIVSEGIPDSNLHEQWLFHLVSTIKRNNKILNYFTHSNTMKQTMTLCERKLKIVTVILRLAFPSNNEYAIQYLNQINGRMRSFRTD